MSATFGRLVNGHEIRQRELVNLPFSGVRPGCVPDAEALGMEMNECSLERNRHHRLRRRQRLVAAVALAAVARLTDDHRSRGAREAPREKPSGNDLLAECLREPDPLFHTLPDRSTRFLAQAHQSPRALADDERLMPEAVGSLSELPGDALVVHQRTERTTGG
jgi:hypothetical protein